MAKNLLGNGEGGKKTGAKKSPAAVKMRETTTAKSV